MLVLLNALFREARQTRTFTFKSVAVVATLSNFVTRLPHEFNALGLFTDVSEGWFFIGIGIDILKGEFVIAVAALARCAELFELFAGLSQVVRLLVTGYAEVFGAGIATGAELTHVHCCFSYILKRIEFTLIFIVRLHLSVLSQWIPE